LKVLFVNPAVGYYTRAISNPLGLMALASYIRKKGHDVRLLDRCVKKINLVKEIDDFAPDAIGISLMSGRGLKDCGKISEIAKKKNIPVIAGGYFPTMSPELILGEGLADFVVLREGELSFEELILALRDKKPTENIKGIAYKKDGKVYITEDRPFADLSLFPEIDWTLVRPEDYFQTFFNCTKMLYLYSSKGCPGRCTFCSNHFYNRSCFRKRPDETVLSEIRYLVENHGMNGVYFSGELWNLTKADARSFCERVKEEKLKFTWGMLSKVGQYDYDDFAAFYDAGCRFICFGVESGNAEMQKKLKKNVNLEKGRETFSSCKKIGITSVVSFMIGLPDETEEQLKDTLSYIKSIDATINLIYLFTPVENTDIHNELVSSGKIKKSFDGLSFYKKYITMENPGYNFSHIPTKELKVIKAYFDWKSFSGKESVNGSYSYAFAVQTIVNGLKAISKKGVISFVFDAFRALKTFLGVFYYSHMFPAILKKYELKQR